MDNRNRISKRGKKKKQRHVLRPLDGVSEYYSEASTLAAFIGLLPLTVVRIVMTTVEFAASGSVTSVLAAVGAPVLCVGLLAAYILAHFGRRTDIAAASSGLLAAVGIGLMVPSELARLFMESDALGIIGTVCMLAFMVCLCVLLTVMSVAVFGARVSPSLGIPAVVAFILAGMTYIFRAATAFSSLLTALGKDYNWDNTGDLSAAKRWILRSVTEDSGEAGRMLRISLIFSVSVIAALLMSISAVFRFRPHFEDFSKRMLISLETLRDAGYDDEQQDDGYDDQDDDFDDDYYYDGIETLESSRYEAERHEELIDYRRESERVRREAAYRAARMGGYRDDGEIYDEIEQHSDDRERRGGGSRDARGGDRGTAGSDRAQDARTPSGALRVKVKAVPRDPEPQIPDPDDASIWDHYLD